MVGRGVWALAGLAMALVAAPVLAADPAVDPGAVLDAVGRDKKRTAAGVGFVLLSEPGSVAFGQPVEDAVLVPALVSSSTV